MVYKFFVFMDLTVPPYVSASKRLASLYASSGDGEEMLRCLAFLRNERRLRSGTKNGPRHFSWFHEHRFRIHLYRRDSGHLQRTLIIHRAPVRVHRYRRLDR